MAHEFRRQKYKRLRPYDQKRKEWRWSENAERCRKKVSKMNSCQASKKGNARTCRKDAIQNNDEEERRTESEQNKKNKTQNQANEKHNEGKEGKQKHGAKQKETHAKPPTTQGPKQKQERTKHAGANKAPPEETRSKNRRSETRTNSNKQRTRKQAGGTQTLNSMNIASRFSGLPNRF